jgi:nucleotide-binding universal stress UspA family protein
MTVPFLLQSTRSRGRPVIACVDGSARAGRLANLAAAYAAILARPLVLFHAVETGAHREGLPDPLDCQIRRLEARRRIDRLHDAMAAAPTEVAVELGEGEWIDALAGHAGDGDALLVIGMPSNPACPPDPGRVARIVARSAGASLLLVPARHESSARPIGRIAVAIDGSAHSAAALAEAIAIARETQAEILLLHVVRRDGLSDFGPRMPGDRELQVSLDLRNERAAGDFLDRTRRRLIDQGLRARARCLHGDPRSQLARVLADEAPDLVILAARGEGKRQCGDLVLGSTASYLACHSPTPLLLVGSGVVAAAHQPDPFLASRSIPSACAA